MGDPFSQPQPGCQWSQQGGSGGLSKIQTWDGSDVEKGARFELDAANPKLTTAKTRVGLLCQLCEGATLGGMKDGDSKVGDGEAWTPKITVKGGNSAFYSIGIGKGE